MKIDRVRIIKAIESGLKDNPAVFAFWLEGADSTDTVDLYSDIDVWLDVRDREEQAIFDEVERILAEVARIDFIYESEHSHPKIRQKAIHLKGTSEYLLIDVCIQSHSRDYEFIRGIGDDPLVIFNKGGIRFRDANEAELTQLLTDRIHHIKNIFTQQFRVLSKIERSEFLEAWMYYSKWTLQPLVELLRIKYSPHKYDHYFKHIRRDLPGEVVSQLEDLVIVSNIKDIRQGITKTTEIFRTNLKEVERDLATRRELHTVIGHDNDIQQ
ncbi:MAG: hypothetical protein JSU58_07370 [Dehalococcoidales bacterium]|nr:MAG: hypothetical protein JSU58_07370 [Dehalococcoidales bacterium]